MHNNYCKDYFYKLASIHDTKNLFNFTDNMVNFVFIYNKYKILTNMYTYNFSQ